MKLETANGPDIQCLSLKRIDNVYPNPFGNVKWIPCCKLKCGILSRRPRLAHIRMTRMQSRIIRRQLDAVTLHLNAVVRIDGLRSYVLARLTSALQTGVSRTFQIEIIRVKWSLLNARYHGICAGYGLLFSEMSIYHFIPNFSSTSS
jgi:hypothetical protein